MFVIAMEGAAASPGAAPSPGNYGIIDYPAAYHGGAGGFSFADGHSEFWRWLEPKTHSLQGVNQPVSEANDKDLWRLKDATYSHGAPGVVW